MALLPPCPTSFYPSPHLAALCGCCCSRRGPCAAARAACSHEDTPSHVQQAPSANTDGALCAHTASMHLTRAAGVVLHCRRQAATGLFVCRGLCRAADRRGRAHTGRVRGREFGKSGHFARECRAREWWRASEPAAAAARKAVDLLARSSQEAVRGRRRAPARYAAGGADRNRGRRVRSGRARPGCGVHGPIVAELTSSPGLPAQALVSKFGRRDTQASAMHTSVD